MDQYQGGSSGSYPVVSYLLQQTLRRLCTDSDWIYAVFWRILPRNYPPPKWDAESSVLDRSKGNKRNWILVWEDGFCDFVACANAVHDQASVIRSSDVNDQTAVSPAKSSSSSHAAAMEDQCNAGADSAANSSHRHYQYMQPELFFKMSHEVYNFGEGLMGKVAADNSHKWIYKDPPEADPQYPPSWQGALDPHPRTWEAQFRSGIETIAIVAVKEGLIQLGSLKKTAEDLNFVLFLQRKFNYLQSIPGVYAVHPVQILQQQAAAHHAGTTASTGGGNIALTGSSKQARVADDRPDHQAGASSCQLSTRAGLAVAADVAPAGSSSAYNTSGGNDSDRVMQDQMNNNMMSMMMGAQCQQQQQPQAHHLMASSFQALLSRLPSVLVSSGGGPTSSGPPSPLYGHQPISSADASTSSHARREFMAYQLIQPQQQQLDVAQLLNTNQPLQYNITSAPTQYFLPPSNPSHGHHIHYAPPAPPAASTVNMTPASIAANTSGGITMASPPFYRPAGLHLVPPSVLPQPGAALSNVALVDPHTCISLSPDQRTPVDHHQLLLGHSPIPYTNQFNPPRPDLPSSPPTPTTTSPL